MTVSFCDVDMVMIGENSMLEVCYSVIAVPVSDICCVELYTLRERVGLPVSDICCVELYTLRKRDDQE
jgi:hypothetical protein